MKTLLECMDVFFQMRTLLHCGVKEKKDESQKAHTEKRKGRCMEDCSEPISKRAKKDEDIDATFQKLHDKYSDDYSDPQLRLWARMCVNGFHDDFDTPPNVPAITGQPVRRHRGSNCHHKNSSWLIYFTNEVFIK